MVFWLLERGADLNKSAHIDITVITPLSFAVRDAAPDLLQELLDYGGDVQKGEVLQYALDRQSDILTVLGMLLDRGAPLDAVMYEEHPGSMQLYFFRERHTPLCKAAMIGNTEAVRFLLERGADPSVQNFKGRTALECAERNGHKKIVEILAQVASYERCRETWTLAEDTTSHRTPQSPGQD
jgi:ankyrin repeat protein